MKRTERFVLVAIAVLAILVVAHMTFQISTDRSRAARLARIKKPGSIAAYKKLTAELAVGQSGEPTVEPEPGETSQGSVLPPDAADTIAAYERFRTEVAEKWGGEVLSVEAVEILNKKAEARTEAEWTMLVQLVREKTNLVEQLRELAARGGPVYPLDFSKGFEIELAHLSKMRDYARLLKTDAVVKAAEGDYAEAVADIIAGMQLGDALAQEPILISQLVRIAIYGIMTDAVQQSLHGGELPPKLISELLLHTAQADNRAAFAECFVGEQMITMQTFAGIRAGDYADELIQQAPLLSDTTTLGQITKPVRPWLARIYPSMIAPQLNTFETETVELLGRTAAAAQVPYYEARQELARIEQESDELAVSHWLGPYLVSSGARTCESQALHETRLDLMQMGLLLEQYGAAHGSYPDRLEAIAPRLGGPMPVDPFTGDPYHYYPSGDSFRLYSVGRNLTDNGGRHDWGEGDIVWRGQ